MTGIHSGQRGPFMQGLGMIRLERVVAAIAQWVRVPGKIALIQPILIRLAVKAKVPSVVGLPTEVIHRGWQFWAKF